MHTNKNLIKEGKKLAYILRHSIDDFNSGLIDINGWYSVEKLINKYKYTLPLLEEIVSTDNKKRYEFNDAHSKIRACQGHSIPVEIDFSSCVPPAKLYHGTALKFTSSILKDGIVPKTRLFVHLSKNIPTALDVGSRHGIPAVFEINAQKMHEDGINFYLSSNGVWLTKYIDPSYIKLLKKL